MADADSSRVYAGTGDTYSRIGQGHVYRSDDGGATSPWTDVTTAALSSARPVTDIAVVSAPGTNYLLTWAASGFLEPQLPGAVDGGGSSGVARGRAGADAPVNASAMLKRKLAIGSKPSGANCRLRPSNTHSGPRSTGRPSRHSR